MIYNGKEMFEMIYDGKIKNDECIQVIHKDFEREFFILRYNYGNNNYGDFDDKELCQHLLFKEYNFKIVKQDDAYTILEKQQKQEKIERLKRELSKLEGDDKQ